METDAARNAAKPKPRTCWYQFGLGTLLIGMALLAIPLCYVGRQVQIVRERRAMLARIINIDKGRYATPVRWDGEQSDGSAPWIRRVLGVQVISNVDLPENVGIEERRRVSETLPEAQLGYLSESSKIIPLDLFSEDRRSAEPRRR